jgi:hypothetical protein
MPMEFVVKSGGKKSVDALERWVDRLALGSSTRKSGCHRKIELVASNRIARIKKSYFSLMYTFSHQFFQQIFAFVYNTDEKLSLHPSFVGFFFFAFCLKPSEFNCHLCFKKNYRK